MDSKLSPKARYHAENTAITDYRLNYKQFYLFLLYGGVI